MSSGELEKSDYGDLRPVLRLGAIAHDSRTSLEERARGRSAFPSSTGYRCSGHTKHLAALPLGVTCTLDADAKTLTVDEPALRVVGVLLFVVNEEAAHDAPMIGLGLAGPGGPAAGPRIGELRSQQQDPRDDVDEEQKVITPASDP